MVEHLKYEIALTQAQTRRVEEDRMKLRSMKQELATGTPPPKETTKKKKSSGKKKKKGKK